MLINQTKSLAAILLILIGQLLNLTAHAEDLKEILVLNSYHIGFKWTADINRAISEHFESEESVRIFYEFMDSKRFNSDEYFEALYQQYFIKYKGHKIDGIICSDNRAFDFFTQHGKEIWGDIPAVFCGVNNINEQLNLVDSSKHVIVHEIIDIKGSIELIEQLQPDLEELIVISDKTLSGNIFLSQFIDAFNAESRNFSYQIINNTEPQQLKQALHQLPAANRAIYLLSLYTQRDGIPNEMIHESRYFFKDVNIPLYSNWDFLMPDMIVGGQLLKAHDQGKLSAELMQQILKHEEVSLHNFPPDYTIFDEHQLNKYQLNKENVNVDFQLINEEISFVRAYKKELIVVLSILSVFIFIILLLVGDIIKRKRIEISFIESEKRLELAINGASEGLWDVEISKNYIYINEQFARMLGYQSANELTINLDNWHLHVFSQDVEQMREAFNLHKAGKAEAFQCEVRMCNKDKSYSWFSIHGKITELIDEEPNRITGVILNISDQKAFENELQKAKEKAEESDRLKSSFLANMSHEIRTPMNAILGFTDLLLYGQLSSKEQTDYLQMIKRGGENLLTLINDIIDISKIESGELKISNELINIKELVNEAYEVALSLCKNFKKHIEIKIVSNIPDDQPFIYTDPLRVYQILLNLLSNAVKFTDKGQIVITYSINEDKHLKISVADTGPGISEKDRHLIFDRFRQVDESTNKKHGGTGLGLSITKSLVELMDGQINLYSNPPDGAEFTIILPVKIKQHLVEG
ncbi:PAS domain-containing protein [Carboxylicivirga mesophila]|uniref:histidine kinase n=1 Tax=Carboxylicivirga mesophila TaxID=1166478 RepID=A0ABS5K910_9BACT|nr:PAS domain-containing hybrid sensor histidine kinase/response regulator [Carboxylicivirga mesophila]MBS2211006.1 PAS domain-containing protein [Carboxylicivirga mesophila]